MMSQPVVVAVGPIVVRETGLPADVWGNAHLVERVPFMPPSTLVMRRLLRGALAPAAAGLIALAVALASVPPVSPSTDGIDRPPGPAPALFPGTGGPVAVGGAPPTPVSPFAPPTTGTDRADTTVPTSPPSTASLEPPGPSLPAPSPPIAAAPPTSTSTSSTTTTAATPAASSGPAVLWSADYETGDDSQWDGVWISGDADSQIVSSPVHSGAYANALTIHNADGNGSSPGVRMTYQGRGLADKTDPTNLPDEAYYSAWYFIPEFVSVDWWNIFQWKAGYDDGSGRTARALYWHDLDEYGDELFLELQTRVTPEGDWVKGWADTLAVSPVPIPLGRWFHLESYYRWDASGNGQITTWLDGTRIWDVAGLTTEFDWDFDVYRREWTVNSYANRTTPSNHTIYVDDAAVSRARLGTGSP
jgi:hypothetical protein